MNNLAFLLVAVLASIIGSLYLWLRTRKPQTFMSSIETFQREMGALGRDPDEVPRRRRSKGTKLRPIVPTRGAPSDLAAKLRAAQVGRQPVPEEPSELRPIVPSTGQQGLADKLRAAHRLRHGDGSLGSLDAEAGWSGGGDAGGDTGGDLKER
ncbi:MAG: hypothetical protein R2726_22415 [Acidimicrobiales bacterium]